MGQPKYTLVNYLILTAVIKVISLQLKNTYSSDFHPLSLTFAILYYNFSLYLYHGFICPEAMQWVEQCLLL